MEINYDFIFKILILGDSFVGKTKLLNCYTKNIEETKATLCLDLYTKRLYIDKKYIAAQFWDTAGQERYKSIISSYYKGAAGAFIIYDITNIQSFLSIDTWINELKKKCGDIVIVIVGNKKDLEKKRIIQKKDGNEKAKRLNAYFFEISAFNEEIVNTVFEFMIHNVYEKNKNMFDESEIEEEIIENEIKEKNKNMLDESEIEEKIIKDTVYEIKEKNIKCCS